MYRPRLTETGPVAKEAKKREKVGAETLIVDMALGTHYNVIQALRGCEAAYIMTKPTPIGS